MFAAARNEKEQIQCLFLAWIWCLRNRTKTHSNLPHFGRIWVKEGKLLDVSTLIIVRIQRELSNKDQLAIIYTNNQECRIIDHLPCKSRREEEPTDFSHAGPSKISGKKKNVGLPLLFFRSKASKEAMLGLNSLKIQIKITKVALEKLVNWMKEKVAQLWKNSRKISTIFRGNGEMEMVKIWFFFGFKWMRNKDGGVHGFDMFIYWVMRMKEGKKRRRVWVYYLFLLILLLFLFYFIFS